MKRFIFILVIMAGIAAFSAAQTLELGAFKQEGIASWYGKEFDGKPTASGEIFNSGLYTAAHPTLPFGTVLTVTNRQNNRRVTVRINDRGPFVAARIIDLSRAAAEVLDMLTTGTAPVLVEQASNTALGPAGMAGLVAPVTTSAQTATAAPLAATPIPGAVASTELFQAVPQTGVFAPAPAPQTGVFAPVPQASYVPAEPQASYQPQSVPAVPARTEPLGRILGFRPAEIKGRIPQADSTKLYRLQVGAYVVPRNAVEAFEKLKNSGLNPAYEKSGDFYRVVLAGLRAGDIQSIAQKLGDAGFREAIIREETGY